MATRAVKQAVLPGSQLDWRFYMARLSRFSIGAVIISLLVLGMMKLNDPSLLPIEKVRAQGAFVNLTEQMLVSKAGHIQGGYFSIDVRSIQENIESLSWVDKAYVRRMWPDTLMITVTEQQAKAWWGDKALINSRGELFKPERKTFPTGLPVLSGPDDTHQQLQRHFQNMNQMLNKTGLSIKQINMDARRSLSVHLNNGLKILLGRDAHYERLDRFMRMYEKILATEIDRIQQIDMRYTNGFTILRQQ